MRCLQLSIRGRVQGVGFRWWMMQQAAARCLRGWARNEPDGSVRALIAGSESAVSEMLAACETGPSGARVASVETTPASDPGNEEFQILR